MTWELQGYVIICLTTASKKKLNYKKKFLTKKNEMFLNFVSK